MTQPHQTARVQITTRLRMKHGRGMHLERVHHSGDGDKNGRHAQVLVKLFAPLAHDELTPSNSSGQPGDL